MLQFLPNLFSNQFYNSSQRLALLKSFHIQNYMKMTVFVYTIGELLNRFIQESHHRKCFRTWFLTDLPRN